MGNYTFIGPDADDALKKYPGKVKENPDVGFASVSDAGMVGENPLKKTPKGYPNIGLSTPPPKPRETVLNIPFQSGSGPTQTQASQPARPNIPTYAANISPANPLASGVLSTRAMRQGREIVTPSNQMAPSAQMTSGVGAMPATGRTGTDLTMGTPGQDGYGKVSLSGGLPRPGSNTLNNTESRQSNSGPANINLLAQLGKTRGTTRGEGFEFSGTAADASKFYRDPGTGPKAASISSPPAGAQSWSDWYDGLGDAYDKRVGIAPKANAATAPGLNSLTQGLEGLGWKTRRDIILQRMKGADDVSLESMREAGADRRMALAQGVEMAKFMGQNDIASKTLDASMKFDQARIGTEEINQQKGQAEVEALNQVKAARDAYLKNPTPETESVYRALIGKFEREAQYGTVDKYDDMGNKVGQNIYNKQTGDLKTAGADKAKALPLPGSEAEMVDGQMYEKNGRVGRYVKGKGILPL